jgi:hypothetical protein
MHEKPLRHFSTDNFLVTVDINRLNTKIFR